MLVPFHCVPSLMIVPQLPIRLATRTSETSFLLGRFESQLLFYFKNLKISLDFLRELNRGPYALGWTSCGKEGLIAEICCLWIPTSATSLESLAWHSDSSWTAFGLERTTGTRFG